MNKGFKNILIVFLLSIAAFSIFKFISIQKEKYELISELDRAKHGIAVLEKEKQNILQEIEKEKDINRKIEQKNTELKKYLKADKTKIISLFIDLKETNQAVEGLSSKISLLKLENETLQQEKERFSQEIEGFKVKLNSINELKKAIKELKKQARKTRLEIKNPVKINKAIEGNRGYLIKNGEQAHSTNLRVEVIPVAK
ncbi:MAG: hypothetical protein QMD94_01345 [Candidatus Omnitrophota bacterium]|nr:hypothetical protein [Candidatus Omnitrophota bacterium]